VAGNLKAFRWIIVERTGVLGPVTAVVWQLRCMFSENTAESIKI
jgi:hypothetical protein